MLYAFVPSENAVDVCDCGNTMALGFSSKSDGRCPECYEADREDCIAEAEAAKQSTERH